MLETTNTDVFTNDFYEREKEKFKVQPGSFGSAKISVLPKITGRLDGYMYKWFGTLYNVPVLHVGNKLWMSVSPMEVQSHHMPIQFAVGRVGVAGLGMGYYVQRILELDVVKEVVVYELNPDVIGLYRNNFGDHPKLTIVNGNFYDIKDEEFDFFYSDIYATGNDLQAIEDMANFMDKNPNVSMYHFWTLESMLFEMIAKGYADDIPAVWQMRYFPFISNFLESDKQTMCNILGSGKKIRDAFIDVGLM